LFKPWFSCPGIGTKCSDAWHSFNLVINYGCHVHQYKIFRWDFS